MSVEALLAAIIKHESSGNPQAVSPAGAKGLMQLMDSTGSEWHQKLGLPGDYDPFNPEQNKTIGSAYIAWLIECFNDIPLALAAYNYGIGNVKRRMKAWNATNFVELRPHLPLETQRYVTNIMKDLKVNLG